MGRPRKQPTPKPVDWDAVRMATKMKPLYEFLWQTNSEWEWYTSPGGYSFIKIKQRKEQAA
jgi:hypothetical protein